MLLTNASIPSSCVGISSVLHIVQEAETRGYLAQCRTIRRLLPLEALSIFPNNGLSHRALRSIFRIPGLKCLQNHQFLTPLQRVFRILFLRILRLSTQILAFLFLEMARVYHRHLTLHFFNTSRTLRYRLRHILLSRFRIFPFLPFLLQSLRNSARHPTSLPRSQLS